MDNSVRITEQQNLTAASILARRGKSPAAIGEVMAIEMPLGPTSAIGDAFVVLGTGPEAWLVWSQTSGCNLYDDLEQRLSGLASVSDQTGAFCMFQIEGPGARTLLQRGVSLDLNELAFPAGSVAVTAIGYVDVIIRSLVDGRGYEVAVYLSYAESFRRWIEATVAGLCAVFSGITGAPIEISA